MGGARCGLGAERHIELAAADGPLIEEPLGRGGIGLGAGELLRGPRESPIERRRGDLGEELAALHPIAILHVHPGDEPGGPGMSTACPSLSTDALATT